MGGSPLPRPGAGQFLCLGDHDLRTGARSRLKELVWRSRYFLFRVLRAAYRCIPGRHLLQKLDLVCTFSNWLMDRLVPKRDMVVCVGGVRLWVDPSDSGVGREIVIAGDHERHHKRLIRDHIQRGMHVVDIGANVGDYTLWFSHLVGSEGHVYAFEPSPHAFRLLIRNVADNRASNVTALNQAVADVDGCQQFFDVPKATGQSSLVRSAVPSGNECTLIEVHTIRLDTFVRQNHIQRCDFIKLDVQGAEYRVLLGALDTLRRYRPKCLLEFWPWGLVQSGTTPEALLALLREHWNCITLISMFNFDKPVPRATDAQILTHCGPRGFCDLLLTA
jgi:FkbM family methyltransferase